MGALIDLEQMGAVDLGIALSGRKACVPEQFLDGAEIGAGPKQMRGEGMTQRMRRRRHGQAERGAGAGDPELDQPRRELLALRDLRQRLGIVSLL